MRITSPNSGNSYRKGGAYGICDVCGFKYRLKELRMRWDNALVCDDDYEARHPQEFVRGRADKIKREGPIRPEPVDTAAVEYLKDGNGDPVTDANGYPIIIKAQITQDDL